MDMIVEPLNICSSICAAEVSPETRGLSLRCSDFSVAFAALPLLSVALCRLMASKTLPIYFTSIRIWYPCYLWLFAFAGCLSCIPQLGAPCGGKDARGLFA